jgi:antitoxin component YwqK of YwqJK toxin-antitoxin module
MKNTFLINTAFAGIVMYMVLFFQSCGNDSGEHEKISVRKVSKDKTQVRGGLSYMPNEKEPFTGKTTSSHENGQLEEEANYKMGKLEGSYKTYFDNGQIKTLGQYLNGEHYGEWASYQNSNGVPMYKTNYDTTGKLDGVVETYYQNGNKRERSTYKSGLLVSTSVFKPDGSPCTTTSIENGTGSVAYYRWDQHKKSLNEAGQLKYLNGKADLSSFNNLRRFNDFLPASTERFIGLNGEHQVKVLSEAMALMLNSLN